MPIFQCLLTAKYCDSATKCCASATFIALPQSFSTTRPNRTLCSTFIFFKYFNLQRLNDKKVTEKSLATVL